PPDQVPTRGSDQGSTGFPPRPVSRLTPPPSPHLPLPAAPPPGYTANVRVSFSSSRPMAKDRTRYVCQACGAPHPKWQGRCDACGEWNTLAEEAPISRPPAGPAARAGAGRRLEFVGLKGHSAPPARIATGL